MCNCNLSGKRFPYWCRRNDVTQIYMNATIAQVAVKLQLADGSVDDIIPLVTCTHWRNVKALTSRLLVDPGAMARWVGVGTHVLCVILLENKYIHTCITQQPWVGFEPTTSRSQVRHRRPTCSPLDHCVPSLRSRLPPTRGSGECCKQYSISGSGEELRNRSWCI